MSTFNITVAQVSAELDQACNLSLTFDTDEVYELARMAIEEMPTYSQSEGIAEVAIDNIPPSKMYSIAQYVVDQLSRSDKVELYESLKSECE